MLKELADHWWSFALRGAFALLFGTLALSYPALTVVVLIVLFGVWALMDGITGVIMALGHKGWVWYLLAGFISVGVGVFAVARPGATALALLFLIGIWAVAKGIVEIIAAIQLRKLIRGEWALMLGGVVSILFGLFVLARLGAGALAVLWLIVLYAYVFGILHLMIGLRLRRVKKEAERGPVPAM